MRSDVRVVNDAARFPVPHVPPDEKEPDGAKSEPLTVKCRDTPGVKLDGETAADTHCENDAPPWADLAR